MLGLRYPENFHRPYLADSVREFWRRWHITSNHSGFAITSGSRSPDVTRRRFASCPTSWRGLRCWDSGTGGGETIDSGPPLQRIPGARSRSDSASARALAKLLQRGYTLLS